MSDILEAAYFTFGLFYVGRTAPKYEKEDNILSYAILLIFLFLLWPVWLGLRSRKIEK